MHRCRGCRGCGRPGTAPSPWAALAVRRWCPRPGNRRDPRRQACAGWFVAGWHCPRARTPAGVDARAALVTTNVPVIKVKVARAVNNRRPRCFLCATRLNTMASSPYNGDRSSRSSFPVQMGARFRSSAPGRTDHILMEPLPHRPSLRSGVARVPGIRTAGCAPAFRARGHRPGHEDRQRDGGRGVTTRFDEASASRTTTFDSCLPRSHGTSLWWRPLSPLRLPEHRRVPDRRRSLRGAPPAQRRRMPVSVPWPHPEALGLPLAWRPLTAGPQESG